MGLISEANSEQQDLFPGQNFFYYWNTSASMWKEVLKNCPYTGPIIIPVNWAFHSETGDEYDFGVRKPETDLSRLAKILKDLSRESLFLIPLSPNPCLPNGGLPHFLARVHSVSIHNHLHVVSRPDEETFHKLYSFFDPRVFQAYTKFIDAFSRFFSANEMNSPIVLGENYYTQNGSYFSFFEDRSRAFTSAFSKFLSVKKQEGEETLDIETITDEARYYNEFTLMIKDLYIQAVKENFGRFYEGVINILYLGSSTKNFIDQLNGQKLSTRELTLQTLDAIKKRFLPVTHVIHQSIQKTVIIPLFKEQIEKGYIESLFTFLTSHDDSDISFTPLFHVALLEDEKLIARKFVSNWPLTGVLAFLDTEFKQEYTYVSPQNMEIYTESFLDTILFLQGASITKEIFTLALKRFLNGGRVVIDSNGLEDDLLRQLQVFMIENSLDVQKVNYKTLIENIYFHEGRLMIFSSMAITSLLIDEKLRFWKSIFETFTFSKLPVSGPEDIVWYTKRRDLAPHEMSYEEIRRVSFYNPTNYKKQAQINPPKNHVLTKVIDKTQTEVKNSGTTIDIDLAPGGYVSLDFGYFS